MSAPFAPFPPEIREDLDVLHITRTWKFNETGLSSEN
jgi:protein TonB